MMPTTMATTMATDMRALGPPEFRLDLPGIQCCYRRLPGDSNLVLADGDTTCQTINDVIAQGDKFVSVSPYFLSAASATQRPALLPGGAMDWDATTNDILQNAANHASLGQAMSDAGAYTFYAVGDFANGNGPAFTFPVGGQFLEMIALTGAGAGQYTHRCNNQSGNGSRSSPSFSATYVIAGKTVQGVVMETYADGVLVDDAATPQSDIPAANTLAWGDYGANPNYDGAMHELLFCAAGHDSTTILATMANLKAWYNL